MWAFTIPVLRKVTAGVGGLVALETLAKTFYNRFSSVSGCSIPATEDIVPLP